MATRMISFDDHGNIESDTPQRALVRFPSEAEQARGITEAPRTKRVREYQTKLKQEARKQIGNKG